jgi:hypothetical protein
MPNNLQVVQKLFKGQFVSTWLESRSNRVGATRSGLTGFVLI